MQASHLPEQELITQRWYPIALSTDLKRKPVGLERFGKRLVLWRDDQGVAHLHDARCPHRGADLALGKVVQGCLQCPYHGFLYEASGACVQTPCDGPQAKIRADLHLKDHPIMERAGVIWQWIGAGQPEGAPPSFEGVDPDYAQQVWAVMQWDVALSRAVEGMLDMYHVPFAHGRYVRSSATMLDPFDAQRDGDLLITRGTLRDPASSPNDGYAMTISAILPCMVRVQLPGQVDVIVYLCPINAHQTWIGMSYRQHMITAPLLGSMWTRFMAWGELKFIQPDDALMLETSTPLHADVKDSKLVRADAGIGLWHKMWREALVQQRHRELPHDQGPQ